MDLVTLKKQAGKITLIVETVTPKGLEMLKALLGLEAVLRISPKYPGKELDLGKFAGDIESLDLSESKPAPATEVVERQLARMESMLVAAGIPENERKKILTELKEEAKKYTKGDNAEMAAMGMYDPRATFKDLSERDNVAKTADKIDEARRMVDDLRLRGADPAMLKRVATFLDLMDMLNITRRTS